MRCSSTASSNTGRYERKTRCASRGVDAGSVTRYQRSRSTRGTMFSDHTLSAAGIGVSGGVSAYCHPSLRGTMAPMTMSRRPSTRRALSLREVLLDVQQFRARARRVHAHAELRERAPRRRTTARQLVLREDAVHRVQRAVDRVARVEEARI